MTVCMYYCIQEQSELLGELGVLVFGMYHGQYQGQYCSPDYVTF